MKKDRATEPVATPLLPPPASPKSTPKMSSSSATTLRKLNFAKKTIPKWYDREFGKSQDDAVIVCAFQKENLKDFLKEIRRDWHNWNRGSKKTEDALEVWPGSTEYPANTNEYNCALLYCKQPRTASKAKIKKDNEQFFKSEPWKSFLATMRGSEHSEEAKASSSSPSSPSTEMDVSSSDASDEEQIIVRPLSSYLRPPPRPP